ncbi:MAG: PEP-CTERM sorting domain-containing protein, partial [Planctomycetota bacterium]|nr:PEP-CTERM sorting domain-containing protein [Planctomycetota bacterium]
SMGGLHIGNHRGGDGARDFDGYIDDMAVFHGVLSPEAVAELYNGSKTPATVTVDEGLAPYVPVIVEEGWTLERTIDFDNAAGISYNTTEEKIYVGRHNSESSGGGVYTIAADDTVELAVGADGPAGVLIDPSDGDVFFSEDGSGNIFRLGSGETSRTAWVTEFNTGDDDPVGMAIVPNLYTGGLVATGSAISVDRGAGGFEEVWTWSLDTAGGETALVSDTDTDDGAGNVFIDLADVAVSNTGIYVSDWGADKIYEITDTVEELITSEPLDTPRSMVADPLTGDLLVMTGSAEVVRIDTETGDVSVVIERVGYSSTWANMFITPDGKSLFIADSWLHNVYEFSLVTFMPGDANRDGVVDDADAAILAGNWQGTGKTWSEGDFNGDGNVDDVDATLLAANWQQTGGSSTSIPEPGALALLAGAFVSLLVWRRRKH